MPFIDRVKSGTTSEKDVEEFKIIVRYHSISGFFIGMFITLVILFLAALIVYRI